VADMIAKY